jgi:hypothetical protein
MAKSDEQVLTTEELMRRAPAAYEEDKKRKETLRKQQEELQQTIDTQLEEARERGTEKLLDDETIQDLQSPDIWKRFVAAFRYNAKFGGTPSVGAPAPIATGGTRAILNTPEVQTLRTAQRSLKTAKRNMEEADRQAQGEKWGQGLRHGFNEKISDAETWSFGVTDLQDFSELRNAAEKYERGEELTEQQETLLMAAAVEQAVQQTYGDRIGSGYKGLVVKNGRKYVQK